MSSLVHGLLEYSRLGSTERTTVGFTRIMQDLRFDLNSSIMESGTVLNTPIANPKIHGNPLEIRLLFQNIISNSINTPNQKSPLRYQLKSSMLKTFAIFKSKTMV